MSEVFGRIPKLFQVNFWILAKVKLIVYEGPCWPKVQNEGNNNTNLSNFHICFSNILTIKIAVSVGIFCSYKDKC